MNETNLYYVPVLMAIAELIKGMGFPVKFIPVVNLVLGLLAGFFAMPSEDYVKAIINGLILGLTASGLYSSTKNVVGGMKKQ